MARVIANDLIKGISGIVGDDLCFRQIGGRTFVVKRPRRRLTFTANQGKQRSRFNQAVYYARTILKDPAKRDAYTWQAREANLRSAYLAAMQDAMRNPEIMEVYMESYQGNAGDSILIAVAQPFKIAEATVTIQDANGAIVETGNALRQGNVWIYMAINTNASVKGSRIKVHVSDKRGVTDSKEIIVDG